jgi:hypothetical protein
MTETTDPNVPEWSDNPAHYAVDQHRPAGGTLTHLSIVSKATPNLLFASYTDDGLNGLLANARDEERYDPHSDRLPSDRAIILAAMRDCGIEPDGEGDPEEDADAALDDAIARRDDAQATIDALTATYSPPAARDAQTRRVMPALEDEPGEDDEDEARDVLERLAEAQKTVSIMDLGGNLATEIEAMSDAHREIAQLRRMEAVLLEALRLAETRLEINNCEGEENEALSVISAAIAVGETGFIPETARFVEVVINDTDREIVRPQDVHTETEEERRELEALVRGEVSEVRWGGGAAPMVVITRA